MTVPIVHANGAAIPAIGLGTSQLLGETCVQAVRAALQAGYRLIDTAARYGNEVEVGEGLRSSGVPRGDVLVTTKVYWQDLARDDFRRSVEASLERLKLEYVDLLLIHWPNPEIPLAESVAALNEAQQRGLTRHIGIANFPVRLIEQAVALSHTRLVANQCEYHPYLDQSAVLTACRRHGLAFMSYSPLRQAGAGSPMLDEVVERIARAKGVTPAQVVLRWHVQQDGVIALPRSSSPHRIAMNLDIGGFELAAAEMSAISALKRPGGRKVSPKHAPQWD